MVNKLVCFLVAFILLVTIASAIPTTISIKTIPNSEVTVFVKNLDNKKQLAEFVDTTNSEGLVSFSSSAEDRYVNIAITVRVEGKIMDFREFTNQDTISPFILDLNEEETPPPVTTTANATANETTVENQTVAENITEETQTVVENITENATDTGKVTGFVALTDKVKVSTIIYFIIALIIIVGGTLAFILGRKMMNTRKFYSEEQARPATVYKSDSSYSGGAAISSPEEEKIAAVEARLKSLQADLNKLKNEEKIKEMEKRIQAEQADLERLRNGEA